MDRCHHANHFARYCGNWRAQLPQRLAAAERLYGLKPKMPKNPKKLPKRENVIAFPQLGGTLCTRWHREWSRLRKFVPSLFRGRLSDAKFQASEACLIDFMKARANPS
jgi:hypothetical protein